VLYCPFALAKVTVLARRAFGRLANLTLVMVVRDVHVNLPCAQVAEPYTTPACHIVASTCAYKFELAVGALSRAICSLPLLELFFSYHGLQEGRRFILCLCTGELSTMVL